jgi:hypothetical protein
MTAGTKIDFYTNDRNGKSVTVTGTVEDTVIQGGNTYYLVSTSAEGLHPSEFELVSPNKITLIYFAF